MNYDRAALKCEVKEDMRLIRPRPLLATLIFLLVSAALTGLIQWLQSWMTAGGIQELMDLMGLVEMAEYGLISDEELVQAVVELFGSVGSVAGISMLFALLSSLITWTLSFGYQGYCLDMVRRKDPSYGRLACALPQLGWVLLTGFLVTVFTFLWTLLMTLGAVVVIFLATLLFGNSFLTSLIAFAALLALAAGVVAISLRYSMANYILLDERVDALEAISRSKAMMRGRKWHLFVLELSFIGWYLLVYLIVVVVVWIGMTVLGGIWFSGLGMAIPTGAFAGMIVVVLAAFLCAVPLLIWLQPYFTGAHAKFYDWSRQADQNSGVWEGRYDDHVPVRPQYESPQPPQPPLPPEESQQPKPEPQPEPGPEPEPPASAPDRPSYE